MPELPEVEVICRGIRPHLCGRTIREIRHSGKMLRVPVPVEALHRHLLDRKVVGVERRAKYLLIMVEDGTILILHLGMTGNIGFYAADILPARHDHVRLLLDNGLEMRFNDTRRFGSLHIVTGMEAENIETTFFSTTGPEPFSPAFSPSYLKSLAQGRSLPVKSFLMTNQVVAGVGNIYANESLFQAGIRPQRPVSGISGKGWQRLITCIREILNHAIDCGGSSISDFVNVSKERGYFQMNFQVYGRKGEPCRFCQRPIEKIQIGGRASYYCPKCQK
jgi:formamidopyrimidine-DNA glycosylase